MFDSIVLNAMTFGSETWALTVAEGKRLQITQRAMERSVLGISLLNRVRNEDIRRRSFLEDVVAEYWRNKLRWAGHVACRIDNMWRARILTGIQEIAKDPEEGQPFHRWEDFLKKTVDKRGEEQ